MSPKKKYKITGEPFDNIQIIGINTSLMDYQLAWYINKTLDIDLIKFPNITPDDIDFFSFYYFDSGENTNAFNLVALSNEHKKWVSFSPRTDFLFLIRNYIPQEKIDAFLQKIKNIPGVIYSYFIDLDDNDKIDSVLEQIEFHEIDILNQQNQRYRQNHNDDE